MAPSSSSTASAAAGISRNDSPAPTPLSPRSSRNRPVPGAPSASASSSPARPSSGAHARGHSRSGSRGVFYDPAVEELCTLETFQNSFNTKDFLAGLSDKLIARSKADPGPFNPRPFIRTFEASVDALLQIRADVQHQAEELESGVRVAENAYAKKLRELGTNFEAVGTSFQSLEDRISEVGRTAIRIGEQLETIDRQRLRASEAHDLIEYYYQFARGDTSRLDAVRKEGGREGRMKAAVIARRLQAISREVDVKGSEQTRETVDRYCERFERDMLKLFDKFYRKSDPKMMGHIARVLQGFNGGASCVQIYVNQHDFFISKDRVQEASRIEISNIWDRLPDPDSSPPKEEPALTALFDEIRSTVEIEAQIIQAVFPNPVVVMQTFLQRVFAQSVQGYVEVLMQKASQNSNLAFLRALQMARSCALALVTDLKVYDFRSASGGSLVAESHTMSLMSTHLGGASPDPSSANSGGAVGSGSVMGAMLDQAVEELFVPYMEGMKYLDRESRNLTELYAAYLLKFSNYHRASHKVKTNTIFDRVRTQLSAAASSSVGTSVSTSSTTPTTSTKSSAFLKLSGLVDRARGGGVTSPAIPAVANIPEEGADAQQQGQQAGQSQQSQHSQLAVQTVAGNGSGAMVGTGMDLADLPIEERDGEIGLEAAERMLRWHAEAIGRCVDLSAASDVPKNAFALLKVLAEAFNKSYVETALDTAIEKVTSQDVRTMPDITPLSVIRQVDMVMHLWQHYVNTALLPLASPSVTVRREMAIFNNHNMIRMEGKINTLVSKTTDNIIAYLSGRLALQKKNDFNPKNDELAFTRLNTDACQACIEALDRVQVAARSSLSGKNQEAFLLEVGVTFHSLLLEHLRKFPVSATGGLMLTKDLASYQEAISAFALPALQDRYEVLRELGNLFIVHDAHYVQDICKQHRIDERLLQPYMLKRV